MFFPQIVNGQISASTPLVAETVESIFSSLSKGVDHLIQRAFERLDLTLLNTAMEARATINAAKTQFDDSFAKSIDQLDGQQRRLIEDLKALNTALHTNISDVTREFRDGINQAMTDVHLLISKNPGAIYVAAKPVVYGDNSFNIEIKGTALSKAQLSTFSISDFPVKPDLVHHDDRRIVYRVKMEQLKTNHKLRAKLQDSINRPIKLRVTLSFLEKSWLPATLWRLFGSFQARGPFTTTVLILPKMLGEIQAVFSATTTEVIRRRQIRGPFHSARVRTTIGGFPPRIRRGRRTDIWNASPSDGWKIDPATAKFDFRLLFANCWSRESSATWTEQTEHILRVKVYISAENFPERLAGRQLPFISWSGVKVRFPESFSLVFVKNSPWTILLC